ncbi:hypothetical protein C1645_831326 [Glomus cerebriforme]|uniref:Uncharacterized protein n=1 Tax=Glomus cerebriforme TaxID=658196 RepID=A0A397SGD2_9GLOM|nr:hypothetical protein C1645_831326 [Glomus cerebriforme]
MEKELRDLLWSVISYIIFLMSDYVKIHKENVMARKASNNAVEILMLLSKIEERTNITLRSIDKENEKDEEDYGME